MTAYNKAAEGIIEEPVTFNCCANSTVLTVDDPRNRKVAQLCQLGAMITTVLQAGHAIKNPTLLQIPLWVFSLKISLSTR